MTIKEAVEMYERNTKKVHTLESLRRRMGKYVHRVEQGEPMQLSTTPGQYMILLDKEEMTLFQEATALYLIRLRADLQKEFHYEPEKGEETT